MAPLEKVNPGSDFTLENVQLWGSAWALTQKSGSDFRLDWYRNSQIVKKKAFESS